MIGRRRVGQSPVFGRAHRECSGGHGQKTAFAHPTHQLLIPVNEDERPIRGLVTTTEPEGPTGSPLLFGT